ncbi:MAG TPA: hypothetical protein VN154_01675 [Rhizomicrobium sp.]|nr:hypothetical protein [Rhizomicrobium sp.]
MSDYQGRSRARLAGAVSETGNSVSRVLFEIELALGLSLALASLVACVLHATGIC